MTMLPRILSIVLMVILSGFAVFPAQAADYEV